MISLPLNSLEALHLIARLPEPDDRRTVRIQLTAAGEALVNEVIPLVFEAQWKRLLPLGEDSRKHLATELKRFADVVATTDNSIDGRRLGLTARKAIHTLRSFDVE